MKFISATVLALGLSAAMVVQASAQQLPLNQISNYLNALKTAQGEFTQINDDGTISTGKIFIKRPGRVRFEYNAPEQSMVVAGAGTVAIFDGKSNTSAEKYPLSRTPLSIILAPTVDLARARMVTGHTYDGTATTVTAQDPEHPEYGNIQLAFTGQPVQLRQWIINDSSGTKTTVILGDLKTGGNLPDRLFNTSNPSNR